MKKETPNKINICFCFDKNQWMQAGVAITSLLISSKQKCSYNIYCIISDDVFEIFQKDLKEIVKKNDINSQISFIKAGDTFINSYISRHLSQATYFRLQIHELLPKLEKIIYCDVDIIFQKDLIEMNNINIGNNLLGAVIDTDMLNLNSFNHWYNKNLRNKLNCNLKLLYGYCINAGVLIMNLKEIRLSCIHNKWKELLKYKFFLHDQDILNISCYKKIKYINPKYNVLVHVLNKKIDEFNCDDCYRHEIERSIYNPTIIHFTSKEKPWLCETNKFFEIWWYFASKTNFYKMLYLNYLILNLKNNIQIGCSISKCKHYLFGLIPVLVSKSYKNKIKYYLFGFILILKIRKKDFIK